MAAENHTIFHLLDEQATARPKAAAILAPGRSPLTYSRLRSLAMETAGVFREAGIGPHDRVAVILPNGPEMAAGFLAVAASAVCAPLNPAYRAAEFEFYFSDLNPRALIAPAGSDSPAVSVARAARIPVLELFDGLNPPASGQPEVRVIGQPDDVALVLHTSGTTSRPKMVPLTHANLCRSAFNVRDTLRLSPEDRCLNVMPLFHIHGLVGALLSSIAAGASIVCAPGFLAPRFFDWMDEFHPTWYTAVPTVHQAILARAGLHSDIVRRCRLRLIRSSSAALPPQVMAGLEEVFQAPVIESYGMTEAAHQMASNPLPPGIRKPGSAGLPAGPEIAVIDESGAFVEPGRIGEIVIRGPNVMRGYENNPVANASAFVRGWFRTGDLGRLDADGYLYISGRVKEIINRGGEKISPREIDEALMDHPAVSQAVAFALPDPRLGEDVAAAVVLREGQSVSETALREFTARRLADFKTPRRIIFLKEIPKGPTGKIQRIGLASKLGLDAEAPPETALFVEPSSPEQRLVCDLWKTVLEVDRVGVDDHFFRIGGDSVLAANLLARVRETTGISMPVIRFFDNPTVRAMAEFLACAQARAAEPSPPRSTVLVPLRPEGSKPPLFLVHAADGQVFLYRDIARHLGPEQPVFGLQSVGLDGREPPLTTVEEMAARYIEEIRFVCLRGPYHLGGFCLGALVAFEMAQQLQARGDSVGALFLFHQAASWIRVRSPLTAVRHHARSLSRMEARGRLAYLAERCLYRMGRIRDRVGTLLYRTLEIGGQPVPVKLRAHRIREVNHRSGLQYEPRPFQGKLTYIQGSHERYTQPAALWKTLTTVGIEVHQVPGRAFGMLKEPHVRVLADVLRDCLDRHSDPGCFDEQHRLVDTSA